MTRILFALLLLALPAQAQVLFPAVVPGRVIAALRLEHRRQVLDRIAVIAPALADRLLVAVSGGNDEAGQDVAPAQARDVDALSRALANLEKLFEDQHPWQAAHDARARLMQVGDDGAKARHRRVLGFLEHQLALQALQRKDPDEAARRFQTSIDLDPTVVPAYLSLGDVRLQQGNAAAAAAVWERIIDVVPDRAYLAFDRLAPVYARLGPPGRFADLCRRLVANSPQEWSARLALGRHLTGEGRPAEALPLLDVHQQEH